MNSCDVCSENILLYLDRELSGLELGDFRAHLQTCDACREEVKAEEELSALLHRSRPLYLAPKGLRRKVMKVTSVPLLLSSHSPVRTRQYKNRVLQLPRQSASRQGYLWGATVATLLLVFAVLLLLPAIVQRSSANNYIEAAIRAHRNFLNGSLPLEVQTDLPDVVTAWFVGKLPFEFRLPKAGSVSGRETAYKLTGGTRVSYRGGDAALVVYQMHKEKISLLIVSSKFAAAAGGEKVSSGGILFHYIKRAGFNVITWTNHGLTYALVSSLPGSGRQSCQVCHQSMVDSRQSDAQR